MRGHPQWEVGFVYIPQLQCVQYTLNQFNNVQKCFWLIWLEGNVAHGNYFSIPQLCIVFGTSEFIIHCNFSMEGAKLPLSVVVLEKSFFLPELGSLVSILILHSVSH